MSFKYRSLLPPTVPYLGIADANTTAAVTANVAMLIPIWLPRQQAFSAFRFARSGAAAGTLDLGIYRINFERLFSTGSIAYPVATSTVQVVPFPTGLIGLAPGLWYLAMSCTNAQTFFGAAAATLINACIMKKAATFPLPATIVTPAESSAENLPALAII